MGRRVFLNDSKNEEGVSIEQVGREAMESRKEDLEAYMEDCADEKELPDFFNYALCFDYVEMGSFNDQEEDYFRYQMSYGGPSDEIRFYRDGRAVYVYLDWFSGVGLDITGEEWAEWLRRTLEGLGSLDFDSRPVPEELYNEEE